MNTGSIFVKNYFSNVWRTEQNQAQWTAQPRDDDLSKVMILYQCRPDIGVFANLQIVFQIQFHEEHPFKAPSIKVLTPNGRMKVGESVCIDGLTAWHPESWNPITSFSSVVERFMCAFIDLENVTYGSGFIVPPNPEEIGKFVGLSVGWNKANFSEIYDRYKIQCIRLGGEEEEEEEEQEKETEYIYSDSE